MTTKLPIADAIAHAGARVLPFVEELLPRGLDDHLSEAVWHHMDTGGKGVRPALCVLACESLGGDSDAALPFAAGVELLHNMFLVHDDLEDGDTVRRDQPTVWAQFGVANAVNVGDYMLAAAYRAVLRSPVDDATLLCLTREFTETYTTTCRGQALDINCRAKADLTVGDYLAMVTLKTGRYLALGMVGAAMISGCDDAVVSGIQELACSMGAAFQIRDDVIDLTIGKGRGGVLGCDIREGKPSILYAHALDVGGKMLRRELVRIMALPREQTTEADVACVQEIYTEMGSLNFASAEADRLLARAFDTIDNLPVPDRQFFRDVAEYMVSRAK